MDNNNYALFYRTSKYSHFCSKRLDLPIEQWEDYCKKQDYYKYDIVDLRTYDASHLHLMTNVVLYKGRYYLPEEVIPYGLLFIHI